MKMLTDEKEPIQGRVEDTGQIVDNVGFLKW